MEFEISMTNPLIPLAVPSLSIDNILALMFYFQELHQENTRQIYKLIVKSADQKYINTRWKDRGEAV